GLGDIGSAGFTDRTRLLVLHTFVGAGGGAGTLAQQAVQAALLSEAGVPLAEQAEQAGTNRTGLYDDIAGPAKGSPIFAAAARLAASPGTTRAWLVAHLDALRAGVVALDALP
ncbi:MAG: hypothetical protein ACRDQ1_18140, partial [Sciscionella sp.]